MAKTKTPKATSSNVKNYASEEAIQQAVEISSLTEFIEKGTASASALKATLTNGIRLDCVSHVCEEGVAYGNYQIPIRYLDEEGKLVDNGNIVEVVLSCDPAEINDSELKTLTGCLGKAHFDTLFQEEEIITTITDPDKILTTLAANPNKAAIFTVAKGGGVSVNLTVFSGMLGADTRTVITPRKGFFINLQEVLNAIGDQADNVKILTDWLTNRIKFAVKTGNRVKETT
jgi:hypothetical protein